MPKATTFSFAVGMTCEGACATPEHEGGQPIDSSRTRK